MCRTVSQVPGTQEDSRNESCLLLFFSCSCPTSSSYWTLRDIFVDGFLKRNCRYKDSHCGWTRDCCNFLWFLYLKILRIWGLVTYCITSKIVKNYFRALCSFKFAGFLYRHQLWTSLFQHSNLKTLKHWANCEKQCCILAPLFKFNLNGCH